MSTTTLSAKIQEAEKARQEFVSTHGTYLKFQQGVNMVQFLDRPVVLGKYGYNYEVLLNGQQGILTLKGVLESRILSALAQSADSTVKVIRAGEGFSTRYVIEPVN